MSEKSLKNSDNSIKTLCTVTSKEISPIPTHGLTVDQVSTQSDENCRRCLPGISHI